jgi:indolepyruvate ferredoxin oxidoreductase alpha subunit
MHQTCTKVISIIERKFLMGNEAIARAGAESGVGVVTGYPGTPVSEVPESYLDYHWIHVEWSSNEKVALEVALGASLCNVRSMAVMKHNGTNVATDFLMHLNFTGVVGGMVLISADDPGGLSSQNEEDTRILVHEYAQLPVFDPSSVAEVKDMIKDAYPLSEKTQLCFVVRPVMRVCHSRAIVKCEEVVKPRQAEFRDDRSRFIMSAVEVPRYGGIKRPQLRHRWLNEKQNEVRKIMEESLYNSIEPGEGSIGLIGCGIGYALIKEALQYVDKPYPVLKLCTLPLPESKLISFMKNLDTVVVFEETKPVVEKMIKGILFEKGIKVKVLGRSGFLSSDGELSTQTVLDAIKKLDTALKVKEFKTPDLKLEVPGRMRAQCIGCSYRPMLHALKLVSQKYKGIVTGDIGCHDAGAFPPMSLQSTIYCMGSSIPIATGMVFAGFNRPVFAVIGDSTFYHNGIIGLINAVYNQAKVVVIMCDNGTTAMTGFQPHAGSGVNIRGQTVPVVDVLAMCEALGVPVRVVDPYYIEAVKNALEDAIKDEGVSLIVSRRPCLLMLTRQNIKLFQPSPVEINKDNCTGCKICINSFGCPAISVIDGKARISQSVCVKCGVCVDVCPFGAIEGEGYKRAGG